MTIEPDLYRRLLREQAIDALPPLITRRLLEDAELRRRWDIGIVTGVRLGSEGPAFDRTALYTAIRSALGGGGAAVDLSDGDGATWQIHIEGMREGTANFLLSRGSEVMAIEDHSALASDQSTRLQWLDRTVETLRVAPEWTTQRRAQLEAEPLSDEAFAALMEDLNAMPAAVDETIRAGLRQGRSDLGRIVPNDSRYYRRLVGVCETEEDAAAYIDGVAGPIAEQLVCNHGTWGFQQALLLCNHPKIADYIPLSRLSAEEIGSLYDGLAANGDPISRVASIEVALKHLDDHPDLEDRIVTIIGALVADDTGDASPYSLLSTIFRVTMGVIARERLLTDARPFYRRQAALAHASLTVRAVVGIAKDTSGFRTWLEGSGLAPVAFLQALIDLQREPRWLPEYGTAAQLRAEVIGRLRIALFTHGRKIKSDALQALFSSSDSLLADAESWPRPSLPGPLEGTSETITSLPDAFRDDAHRVFEADSLDFDDFLHTVNIAYVSGDVDMVARKAASALERLNYLIRTDDEGGPFQVLAASSTLAAAARNEGLAEAVQILARLKRRRGAFRDDPENEIRIALIAGAAFQKREAWARFLSEWVTELAFSLEAKNRAESLLMIIRRLTQLDPSLRRDFSKAEAVLSAFHRQL